MLTYRELRVGESGVDPLWTFPSYRHLLSLEPSTRFAEGGRQQRVRPVAVVACRHGTPVGLGLACTPEEMPSESEEAAELLSLSVARDQRRRGIGSALVAELEERVANRGHEEIEAVYMTGATSDQALEAIFRTRQWTPPERRMLAFRSSLEQAMRMEWFGRFPIHPRFTLRPWHEIPTSSIDALRASDAARGWIAQDLRPWLFDIARLEPASSLGVLLDGQVVGWMLNHRIDPKTVRTSCAFIRPDLSRRARLLPVAAESLRRARSAGYEHWWFAVPIEHGEMYRFTTRWCAPRASFLGETRSSRKKLVA